MITLDTSAIFALLNTGDRDHGRVYGALTAETGPLIVPISLLGELSYLVEHRLPSSAMDRLLSDLESGAFTRDDGWQDLFRIRQLIQRYAGFPLGFVDAAVIACAERHGGRVLTLDLHHFGTVAREGTISLPLLA